MNLIASEFSSKKFNDPKVTLDGSPRAVVEFDALRTLWFNTGTLCNLTCENCYIESSPSNDQLTYLTLADVRNYLEEIATQQYPVREIGFTGGEPFMDPDFMDILQCCLERGFAVLVLTNAMRPMMKCADHLSVLAKLYWSQLTVRVSVDHYRRELHEQERGKRAWLPMLHGLQWLSQQGIRTQVAGRLRWGDDEAEMRAGFARLFDEHDIAVNTHDPSDLVLFAEMDDAVDVPEITDACWSILGVEPHSMMCASSRMVVRHRGAERPSVVACTLLPYEAEFNLGDSLEESLQGVALNHRYCAQFCVLGGSACS